MRALLATALGVFCLVAGLAFILTPIPLGAPLIGAALALLVTSNRFAARLVLLGWHRLSTLDRGVNWLERRGGARLRRVLRRTRPGRMPRRLA